MSEEAKTVTNGATDASETKAASSDTMPIFGSASTFGAGAGFGGFTGVAGKDALASTGDDGAEKEKAEKEGEVAEEEECSAEYEPVVQLSEVEVSTGEEEEETLENWKCKLYRFDNDAGEWKERGVGQAKLLQHKENRRVRFLMRQDKTLKIRGNHVIMPGAKIQEHGGSEKAMVWSCVDFADEVQKPELFCIRFASQEKAQEFKQAYEKAAEMNEEFLNSTPSEEPEEKEEKSEVEAAADELQSKAAVSTDEAKKE